MKWQLTSVIICLSFAEDADLRPNGKKCHFCVGDNCLGTLHCEGIEDRCITYIGVLTGKEVSVKGCASKSVCDLVTRPNFIGMNMTQREMTVKCCEGNLCNSAESIPLSFLLMSLFLLPSFLIQ
ncbi:urokinase plasminogen activator surface receptor-like [Clarias gariepinus]